MGASADTLRQRRTAALARTRGPEPTTTPVSTAIVPTAAVATTPVSTAIVVTSAVAAPAGCQALKVRYCQHSYSKSNETAQHRLTPAITAAARTLVICRAARAWRRRSWALHSKHANGQAVSVTVIPSPRDPRRARGPFQRTGRGHHGTTRGCNPTPEPAERRHCGRCSGAVECRLLGKAGLWALRTSKSSNTSPTGCTGWTLPHLLLTGGGAALKSGPWSSSASSAHEDMLQSVTGDARPGMRVQLG